MDTKNQFIFFLLSVSIGLAGGLLYEIFAIVRLLFGCDRGKRKAVGIASDILFGLTFSFFAVCASYFLRFPDFRGYFSLGWLIGLIIYSKTLRIILAFFEKVCYNIIAKMVKRAKSKEKTLKKERI